MQQSGVASKRQACRQPAEPLRSNPVAAGRGPHRQCFKALLHEQLCANFQRPAGSMQKRTPGAVLLLARDHSNHPIWACKDK